MVPPTMEDCPTLSLQNGQMDVPPAGSFPYFNGMDRWRCLGWQLPILQEMKPSMHSQVVQKKVACAQKTLNWM